MNPNSWVIQYEWKILSDKNEQRLTKEWLTWKNKFGKVYESMEEEIERYVMIT